MKYNFDEIISRNNTLSLKWKEINNEYISMGLADMDLLSPIEVKGVLIKRASHGMYGYGYVRNELYNLIVERMKKIYSWNIEKEWISFLPGVLDGVTTAVRILSKEDEGVIIQKPVYTPFMKILETNNRRIINNELIKADNSYKMNIEDLMIKAKDNKVMILCSPHNPVGRVWSERELEELTRIAYKEKLTIISDEIHSDIILGKHRHIPLASINKDIENISITLMSASKSFNIPGLSQAFAIIPNKELKEKFDNGRIGMNKKNIFGLIALEECYRSGDDYLEELKEYLNCNLGFVRDYFKKYIPMVDITIPEGTYLLWMDFSRVFKTREELNYFIKEKCKLVLNEGYIFGENYYLFQRLNFACPRSYLEEALRRIRNNI